MLIFLPQAFARLSAVYGGTYMLNKPECRVLPLSLFSYYHHPCSCTYHLSGLCVVAHTFSCSYRDNHCEHMITWIDLDPDLVLGARWNSMRKGKLKVSRQKGRLLGAKKLSATPLTCLTR